MLKIKNKSVIIFGSNSYIAKKFIESNKLKKYDIYKISRKSRNNKKIFTYKNLDILVKKIKKKSYKKIYLLNLANNPNVVDYFKDEKSINKDTFEYQNKIISFSNIFKKNLIHLYISSDRIFGNLKGNIYPNSKSKSIDPYAKLKIKNENLLQKKCKSELIIIRATNIYGPGQKNNQFIPSVIKQIKINNKINVGNINGYRDYLYIDDLINGIFKIISCKNNLKKYHFSNKKENLKLILTKITNKFQRKYNIKITINTLDNLKRSSKYELGNFKIINNMSKKYLGWKPRTNIDKGIDNILSYEFK